jgi:glycosyltransferase involved in cell wall biosynthesis
VTLPGGGEKIRVLHIITRLILGGAQQNTVITASRLNAARYDVTLVSGPQTGSEGELISEAVRRGVRLRIFGSLVREIHPWKDLLAVMGLYRLMRGQRFSIVHTHSSKAGILGRIAARMARVPIVVHTVHGWGFHDHMSKPRRWLLVTLERWVAAMCNSLVVVSSLLKETGLRSGIGSCDQYSTIYSGIDLSEFDASKIETIQKRLELSIPPEAAVVGTVGRLSPQKNPMDLLIAARKVIREVPGVRFVIVGDGPLRGRVEDTIQSLGISQNVLLTGLRRDVPAIMATFDLFVLSSLWEGLPRVLPQAMAAGKPVVCTDVDGNAEAVVHGVNGLLVPPRNPESLADAILRLLKNPDLARKMGSEGRMMAAKYSSDKMVSDIETLYERLLAEAGSRVAEGSAACVSW